MYEYKFQRIRLGGTILSEKKPEANYYEVIREYAKEGWRLVQIFAPTVSVIDGGTANYYELIFEKEIE